MKTPMILITTTFGLSFAATTSSMEMLTLQGLQATTNQTAQTSNTNVETKHDFEEFGIFSHMDNDELINFLSTELNEEDKVVINRNFAELMTTTLDREELEFKNGEN